MKICLITASTATDFEDPDDAMGSEVRSLARRPHLGVLALAAVLERRGFECRIVNLNRLYYDYLAEGSASGVAAFADWAAGRILSREAEVYGFSSLCSSYPLTIRIAASVKRDNPGAPIILGGPQASVVDLPTLAAFPFIDFVLRGEADETLPLFLDEWSGSRRFAGVPGLTWRSPFGPARNGAAPIIEDLDSLPLPAYEMDAGLKEVERVPLELGRGCPFSCTFCSTNDFFRRKFRVKSPQRMLADMREMARRFGFRQFDLTHDMFTVDRRRVVDFCNHMLESGEGFQWACSARTDCVDEELLELMAKAGCQGMFFGIETGSRRMQKIIDKGLDPDRARAVIATAERLGISTDVALITGFPEETWDDLRQSLDIFVHAMRHPRSTPQLNLLAPLAGTPIHSRHQDQMVLEDLCSDMSHQGSTQNQADRELIRRYPQIFPNFYLLPAPGLERGACVELREFLLMGLARLRWLITALHDSSTGLLDVFLAWRVRRIELHPELNGGSLRRYYTTQQSGSDFLHFVRERGGDWSNPALEALLAYHEAFLEAEAREDKPAPRGTPVRGAFRPADIPVRRPHLHVFRLEWDVQSAVESLKRSGPPAAVRKAKRYRTSPISEGQIRLIEISPLLARALELCDGRRRVEECLAELARCFQGPRELRRCGAECVMEEIRDQGLIEVYRRPAELTAETRGTRRKRGEKQSLSSLRILRVPRVSAVKIKT